MPISWDELRKVMADSLKAIAEKLRAARTNEDWDAVENQIIKLYALSQELSPNQD